MCPRQKLSMSILVFTVYLHWLVNGAQHTERGGYAKYGLPSALTDKTQVPLDALTDVLLKDSLLDSFL